MFFLNRPEFRQKLIGYVISADVPILLPGHENNKGVYLSVMKDYNLKSDLEGDSGPEDKPS